MTRLLDRIAGHVFRSADQPIRQGRIAPAMPDLPENYLKTRLDAIDSQPEVKRLGTGEGEYGHYIHVSSLIGACARQHALAAQDNRQHVEAVTGGHRVMWAFGRAVEAHIRKQFLIATGRATAFGHWHCPCEREWHSGHFPAARVCEACGKGLTEYKEYTLYDHENWIKGNPDLLIHLSQYFIPTEIKSLNKKEWDAITQPKGDHVFQVSMYHDFLALNGFQVHDKAIIIYCAKDFTYGSPYKEFHVDMTARHIQTLVQDAKATARTIRRARENGILPQRSRCSTHRDSAAKQCPFVVPCFSR